MNRNEIDYHKYGEKWITHLLFGIYRVRFFPLQTPIIVNGPHDGIWNDWNRIGVCVTLYDEIRMVGSFIFHQLSHSGFFFIRAVRVQNHINKRGLRAYMYVCNVYVCCVCVSDEHVVSCCGVASFHYMAQSHVYFSISVNSVNTLCQSAYTRTHSHGRIHIAFRSATGPRYCCCIGATRRHKHSCASFVRLYVCCEMLRAICPLRG